MKISNQLVLSEFILLSNFGVGLDSLDPYKQQEVTSGLTALNFNLRIPFQQSQFMNTYHARIVPVDGGWNEWSSWGEGSQTIEPGSRSRTRPCNNPVPVFGGTYCDGKATEDEPGYKLT